MLLFFKNDVLFGYLSAFAYKILMIKVFFKI